MSESKRTPGTWHVPSYAPYQVRSTEKREEREIVVVDCRQPNPPICYTQEEVANAQLIAAAPVLLAACKDIESKIVDCEQGHINWRPDDFLQRVRAAIAKAEGE
jgi:hypothetical protein